MADDRDIDLASLTLEDAGALVGREFTRPHAEGPDVPLRLVAAETARRDPTSPVAADGRPFVLLFAGPEDPVLTQGMHDLEHPDGSLRGLFLVPVGAEAGAVRYEAVFS